MYEDLLIQLEQRGLCWDSIRPFGGLSDSYEHVLSDDETCKWIIDIAEEITSNYPQNPTSFHQINPKALILLGQSCHILLHHIDGVLSKDLANIAFAAANEQGTADLEMSVICNLMTCNGRFLDCISYFQEQLKQSKFDTTFAPDVAEVLTQLEKLYDGIKERLNTNLEDEFLNQAAGNILMLRYKIARGSYLQLECSLKVATSQNISEFIETIAPLVAGVCLAYAELPIMSPTHYTQCHSLFAYSSLILQNLTPFNVPIESLLDEANKACMDEKSSVDGTPLELNEEERYYTLFGHLLRLRLFRGLKIDDQQWRFAVSKAEEAISKSEKMNNIDTLAEVIENLKDSGLIKDMFSYSNDLSRTI